ncbi:MAG: hypothetical protein AAF484_16240, partial [Pseudomonadota bacterium]
SQPTARTTSEIRSEGWRPCHTSGGEKTMLPARESPVEMKARVERYRLEDQKQATDALNAIRTLPK